MATCTSLCISAWRDRKWENIERENKSGDSDSCDYTSFYGYTTFCTLKNVEIIITTFHLPLLLSSPPYILPGCLSNSWLFVFVITVLYVHVYTNIYLSINGWVYIMLLIYMFSGLTIIHWWIPNEVFFSGEEYFSWFILLLVLLNKINVL